MTVNCSICAKNYSSIKSLARHVKTVHHRIKDLKCDNDNCNYITGDKDHLTRHKKSCGVSTRISSGEKKIIEVLNIMNINHVYDKPFEQLTLECKQNLRFDFYCPEFKCVIEFDGKQHYEPVNFGGGVEQSIVAFERTVQHDNIKNDFCARNGYDMLRIKYNDYLNIERILYDYFMTKGWNADAH